MLGNSSVAERLAVSQEGLGSLELANYAAYFRYRTTRVDNKLNAMCEPL
jgi:hypothetical protein